jgi:hypothetical protein
MHRKALCLSALLAGALACLPGFVAGQSKNNNKAQPATSQDYYLIQNEKYVTGQLLSFDDSAHTASVRIDFPEYTPNPRYRPNTGAQHSLMADYNRLMQEQQRIASSRNPRQMQQHYINMMNLQNRIAMDQMRASSFNPSNPPFLKKDHLKDFDLEIQTNVVYRKMFLPQEYDDTGNLIKLSAEEKNKLRGNDRPKGSFSAKVEEFHPGQMVYVYLTPPSKAASTSSSSSSSAKKDDKDGDAQEKVPHPTVKMLVIAQEGSLPSNAQKNKAKK